MKLKLNFNDEQKFVFNTTKDLLTDFTQFYNLNYEYETDCLSASFEYKKNFLEMEILDLMKVYLF